MTRVPEHPIDPQFLHRWSSRAMSGEPMEKEDLFRLFEAARWAPSSGNNQPWRFVYGRAGTPAFATLFELLAEGNRSWCQRAGALVVVASKTTRDSGKPARTHSYDTGAAWMSLALQGSLMGFVVHGMEGFDYDRARTALEIPDEYQVEAMIAIGHPGRLEDLSEKHRAMESPNSRHPIETRVFEHTFGNRPK